MRIIFFYWGRDKMMLVAVQALELFRKNKKDEKTSNGLVELLDYS